MSVLKIYYSAEERDFLAADQRFSSNNVSNSMVTFLAENTANHWLYIVAKKISHKRKRY